MYMLRMESACETIAKLKKAINIARLKNTALGLRHRCKTVANIETLKVGSGGLKKQIQAVKYLYFCLVINC